MQINKGDTLLFDGGPVTILKADNETASFMFKGGIYIHDIKKEIPKPLYHDGQIVVKKATSFAFRIDSHYHDGNGYVYSATNGASFETFNKEETLRPLTEQEKQ